MKLKSKPLNVIQIVPQMPPYINGLGDYALNLARQLWKDYEIETSFIVGDPSWQGTDVIESFSIQKVAVRSTETLVSLLSSQNYQSVSPQAVTVLLHYVGYAYANRGCPHWLVEALELWKAKTSKSHLVTMFHEVYASGPPWSSAFWLSGHQRKLAARLVKISDRCLTNKQLYAEILCDLSQGKQTKISIFPVFSNVGEPEQVPPLAKRSRRLVVFGSRGNRLRVYQKSLVELNCTCHLLEIEEICDIGSPTGLNLSSINNVPLVEMGERSATEISYILLNSLAGFFEYNPEYLAKSGIFAAYCAHGMLPISHQCNTSLADGIEPGKHYWLLNDRTTGWKDLVEMQAMADNAYAWYQTHRLSVQTKTFASYLIDTDKSGGSDEKN